ncbi:hypothetical protein JCM21714_4017 [Gracilibacillus boraciitolerans JCM 21714]|uniref:Uncharacterized protein n=1 Tax=Gracilibacillus boraciitolerans JCM 21714 TaxID=1298598 RepID=W4VPQ7_9BACI|nr:hypothetical protein [Gracilibacillus boraciitolerans]GAE94823.1 hypothetical protein JCM21714_4017 [Gracilibacillus boraciitolerans JCM 21714]
MDKYLKESISVDEYFQIRENSEALDEKMYEQHDMKTETGEITFNILDGLCLDLKNIFPS